MNEKWKLIEQDIFKKFNKKPDINAVLFLIGIRELGTLQKKFNKEEKTELMHIALCKVFSYSGYYKQLANDKRGWPVWQSIKKFPVLSLSEQENLIKENIIKYFVKENLL